MEQIKLIIAGGRDFNDYGFFKSETLKYFGKLDAKDLQIVSGGAKGVDAMGEMFAREKAIETVIFNADWNKYGRSAGPKRNALMADYATHLLAFWDGRSKGTKSMIDLGKKKDLKIHVVALIPKNTLA